MGTLADFRRQYPQYDDMSDAELAEALHRKYYSDLPKAEVFKRFDVKVGAPAPTAAAAAVTPAKTEEESGFYPIELGKSLIRGAARTVGGFGGKFLEDLPENIADTATSVFTAQNPIFGPLLSNVVAGKLQENVGGYKEAVAPAGEAIRGAAQRVEQAVPQNYATFDESKGFWESLGSLGLTVGESTFPVLAGAATAYITKNPALARSVITAGAFPQTYSGIRETQEQTGIDDRQRALVASTISSAVEALLGSGEKAASLGATALKEFLETGLKKAAVEVAKTSSVEGGTEVIQNIIEQVGGGLDPTAKDSLKQTLEAGLAGMLGGATFAGAVEGVQGVARRKIRKQLEAEGGTENFAQSPEVQQEYLRLLNDEVTAAMAQDPKLTQRKAFDSVKKNAADLYQTAVENIILASGEVDVGPDTTTGLDDGRGPEPSVPISGGPAPTIAGPGEVTAVDTGRLGEPTTGVSVPDAGQGAQPSALDFEAATLPIYEAPTIKERKAAAKPLVQNIIDTTYGDIIVPAKVVNQVTTQMAQRAARKETFNPSEIVQNVLADNGIEAPVATEITPVDTTVTPTTPEIAPEVVPTAPKEGLLPTGTAPLETFAGEPVLQHGRADTQVGGPLEGFTAPEAVTPGQRYGVEGEDLGGVFGSEGVYLASDPKWFTDMSGMYTPDIYDVSAPLENALVLTPDNIGSLPKKDTPWKGKEIADWAKSQGYDGVVVEGFDDLFAKLGAAQQPLGLESPEGPEFTPRGFKRSDFPREAALSDLETASVGIPADPNYVTETDVFRGYLRSKGVDPEIGQDQVFAFNPEKLKVLGKAEKPTERVSFRKTAAPAAPAAPETPKAKKPKVVSKGKEVKLTEAQTREALAKADAARSKMNRIQRRIAMTNKTSDVLSGQIELAKLVRGDEENIALLKGAVDTLNRAKWRAILPALDTFDIFRILDGRIEGLTEADRIIRNDVTKFETKEYMKLAGELDEVSKFLKQFPKAAQALSDLQFASVAYQVDPSRAENAGEYAAKVDKKNAELKQKLASEKDPKKRRSLETKIKNRLGEIKSVYEGVPGGDEAVYGWRDLSRRELGGNQGKEIFKLIRDAHRRDLEASYNALRSHLMETKEGEKLDEALDKLEEKFAPARGQVIYFPAMRFGQYYARVGSGENSIFKMFETETKRNQFVRLMEARGEEVTQIGNVEDLRNDFEKSGPIKEVLDLFEGNPKDLSALKSQVFDIWLQTLSSGDMRKHMAPRKMRAGYSTDILKNYANFRRSSINSAKRATFGYKLRNELERAKDSVQGQPDQTKMETFVNEIELRAMAELMPSNFDNSVWDQAIRFGNKMAFYQYLANPKTALIQLTQMHIVALPMLSQRFGTIKSTAALSKYGFSSLGGFVVSPLKAIKREDGGVSFNWEQPNLLDNPISALKEEKDPELYEVLSEGWQEGRDINLYMDTFANDIGGYGNLDPNQRNALQELAAGRPVTAALRGATFTFEAMGALMHQMERVNREATYMAALELAYRDGRKAGKSHEVAKQEAIKTATDLTLEATFDFSAYNKPRVLTSPAGRIAGQFMTYPYMMTSLLARNMYTAIKFGPLEPGERLAAAQVATGALVNIGLYAGLTGIPLYGLFKGIGKLLAWAIGDDDEERGLSYLDEDGNIKWTYDIDWWTRNVFIPQHFGPDGTVANLFGLDDGTAELLARSVEKGPISAITDIDLANSVALDFLFFLPKEPRSEKLEDQTRETVFNMVTGAAGGTIMDYIRGGQDLMAGYTGRALEKLPKLVGNVFKANRFAEEGQVNYNHELVGMDKDFWTSDKAVLQALGFNSTEADQRQQQNYEAKAIDKRIEGERNKMLATWRKFALDAYAQGYTPEISAEREKVLEEWRKFNDKFPTHIIGIDTLSEVQMNAIKDARRSEITRGVPMDAKGKTPYLRDIYAQRIKSEQEKK